MKYLLALLAVFSMACGPGSSDTRGMCRDLEVCQDDDCHTVTVWYECDCTNEDYCEWQELDQTMEASNSKTVPCEECDIDQCPEGTSFSYVNYKG